MGKRFKILEANALWKHLLAILLCIILLTALVFSTLRVYTDHGNYIDVPDLEGLTFQEACKKLKEKNLRCKVSDSTFARDKPLKSVIAQNPGVKAKVKEKRNIYVTLNVSVPPNIKIPKEMKYASLRYAKELMAGIGLVVSDKLEYVSDPAKNVVLGIKVNGKTKSPGDEVPFGAEVTLQVGDGYGNNDPFLEAETKYGGLEGQRIPIPNLVGMTYRQAKLQLSNVLLREGQLAPDPDVEDMDNAIVYDQIPASSVTNMVSIGSKVDLFLKRGQ